MLAKTKMEKLLKQIKEVQKRTKVRNLSPEYAQQVVARAEEACKKLPPFFRDKVQYVYCPWEVAGSYGYPAKGTGIIIRFNKAGKPIWAEAKRMKVYNRPRIRFELTDEAYVALQSLNKYEAQMMILRLAGFTVNGTKEAW